MSKTNKKHILDYFDHVFILIGSILLIVIALVVAVNFSKDSRIFAKQNPEPKSTVAITKNSPKPTEKEENNKYQEPSDRSTSKDNEATSGKSNVDKDSKVEKNSGKIKVEIINSSGKKGLGSTLGNTMKNSGLEVVAVKSGAITSKTKIINRNNNDFALDVKKLVKMGSISKETIKNSKVDVTVILGSDYLP
ncbi:MAG: LytR C-terminal domain-containing protein [Bacillota bacterium]|nr:LytR C-terminal domain-containing protein [Bacillota bacterium]